MAINVSNLTKYVEENRLPLIRKAILDGSTISRLNLMTGVKYKSALNILDSTIELGNGRVCGFSAAGADTFTQRILEAAAIKVNKEWCDKTMSEYWMNNQVRMAARPETLPFEEEFVENMIKNVNAANEDYAWRGITIGAASFPGFLTLAADATTPFTTVTLTAAEDTIYKKVMAVYNAIPSNSLRDTAIFVGRDNFRALVQELVAKNLFNYATDLKDDPFDLILPGTNTHVYGVAGLDKKSADTKGYIVALNLEHAFAGVDMTGDEEEVKVWFSDDADVWRAKIAYALGFQVAFPEENVYAEWTL